MQEVIIEGFCYVGGAEYGFQELAAHFVAHASSTRSGGGALASEMNILARVARIFRVKIPVFLAL